MTNKDLLESVFKFQPRREGGRFYFIKSSDRAGYEKELESDVNRLKTFLKKWPAFYYFLLYFASTIFFMGLSTKKALKKVFPKGISGRLILNIGSGPRRYPGFYGDIINLDIYPFENVDIVADVTNLPFKDASLDMVIAESLLEHVSDTQKAVSEISRVVKPGGYIYILVPFLYPFHSSPNDYYRWTTSGLRYVFSEFEIVSLGARSGPISAALSIQMHYLATLFSFGWQRLYFILVNIFMVLLAPFKIFDWIFSFFPQNIDVAAFIYFLGRKK